MGLGDDLLFLGKAEEIYKETGRKITPVEGTGWSPFFDNVEFLVESGGLTVNARDTNVRCDYHVDYYEQRKETTPKGKRVVFRDFNPAPFTIRLTEEEKRTADKDLKDLGLSRFCVINPDYKSTFYSDNKNWGFQKYQDLVNRLYKLVPVLRIMPVDSTRYNEPELVNATNIKRGVRDAMALIRRASFGVSYDGLLQHAFAGFNIPCVVIQGGLINTLHYPSNIYHIYDHPLTPCGSMYNCSHCVNANESITVDEIFKSCKEIIDENVNNSG